jgi:hypothetical protein
MQRRLHNLLRSSRQQVKPKVMRRLIVPVLVFEGPHDMMTVIGENRKNAAAFMLCLENVITKVFAKF